MSNGLQWLRIVYKMALFGRFPRIFGVVLAAAWRRFRGKIFAVLADFARSHPQTCKMEGLTASLTGDQVTRSRGVRPLVGVSGAKPLSGGWGNAPRSCRRRGLCAGGSIGVRGGWGEAPRSLKSERKMLSGWLNGKVVGANDGDDLAGPNPLVGGFGGVVVVDGAAGGVGAVDGFAGGLVG